MISRFSAMTLAAVVTIAIAAQGVKLSGQETEDRIPLNLPGVTRSVEPPEGFEALQASDEELARFGYPPRPDMERTPHEYEVWQKVIAASKIRIVPDLEFVDAASGPGREVAAPETSAPPTKTSLNWSGSVVHNNVFTYDAASALYYIEAKFVVPAARQTYGTCDGKWDRERTWVGIDGWGSPDVIQAGTESDGFCNKAGSQARYYAWFDWYPGAPMQIKNFPVHPGDDMFVQVWYTSPTQADMYVVDYETNQAISLGFTAPKGTSLIGNSAEWVVERPTVNGKLTTLANYISEYFSDCALLGKKGGPFSPGIAPAFQVNMLDDNGNPVSYPTLLGTDAIWLQSERSVE